MVRLGRMTLTRRLQVSNLGSVTLFPGFVTPTSLITADFTSHWTDDIGVRFTSTVLKAGGAPYYSVRAERAGQRQEQQRQQGPEGKSGAAWHHWLRLPRLRRIASCLVQFTSSVGTRMFLLLCFVTNARP